MVNELIIKKNTVIIVDDHKLIREMWHRILADIPELVVAGESGDFHEAIELIKTKRPNLVLLDINLPPATGMDAVPVIRKFSPGTKIIAVSAHNQPAYPKKMLQLGAKGYLTKNSSVEEILKAINEVIKGNKYVCSEIKDIISRRMLSGETTFKNPETLSLREIEIVKFLREGFS